MAEASLHCYTRQEGRRTLFAMEGCLDLETSPRGLEKLQAFIKEHGPNVEVDTSRLDFIDSKGVGTLLAAAKAAKDAGGHLALPEPALPVRKILETCGLMTLFAPKPAAAAVKPTSAATKPAATRKKV